MQLFGECTGRLEIVPERLLDDNARRLRQAGLHQSLDDGSEEERRDLEVEDRRSGFADRGADALVDGGVGEVARDVGEATRETVEDLRVDRLARALDRVACPLDEVVDRPVVHGDADDRAVEEAALLEPVQRAERHHLREIPRDAEDHEDVRRLRTLPPYVVRRSRRRCCAHPRSLLFSRVTAWPCSPNSLPSHACAVKHRTRPSWTAGIGRV
jgi:hypothetical protein